jgi:type I restriction enzyme M protein
LFYNTGIATYIWILSNHKTEERKGKVQLIDATSFWKPMRKSLGDKRREMSAEDVQHITQLYEAFEEGAHSKLFTTTEFGYRKITVERPLRLNFQVSAERLERLKLQGAFSNLAQSKKKDKKEKEKEEREGRKQQAMILAALQTLPDVVIKDRRVFEAQLDALTLPSPLERGLPAPVKKAILAALAERDETAEICRDKNGDPEPDPDLRDNENVPLNEDIYIFFEREVKPYVPEAWINTGQRDEKDKQIGKVGYEINFNRYFYEYQPPRDLEVIEAEIKTLEKEIMEMLREVTE